ncbi:MAG: hypothetical protein IJS19_02860, partial [Muribaculaceae bacterium]|nr:hypothetical protein [Muribaculaceae bacterium]
MNSTLTIYNPNGTVLATVVVNEGSMRRYELMKDDYIVIKFSLAEPIDFKRGDYADVADMGRFVVTDKVTTAYNTTTGGYDYQLRLDAQYMRWKNKLIKFLPQIGCAEVSWSLTATAQVHLEQIVANVNSLGSANDTWHKYNGTTDWDCSVSNDIDPDLAKAIDYDGITIIDALAAVAEAFETEWYVVGNTIYLGKCQDNTEDALVVSLGDSERADTAASMSRSDSKTAQATRIYPYGSDRNIPSKYRKDLVLDALTVTNSGARFSDTTRKMLGGYFKTIVEQSQKDITLTNLQVCNAGYAQGKKNIVVSDWSPFVINHGSQQRPVWNSAAAIGTLEKGAYYLDFTNFNLYAYIGCNKDFENYDFRNQYNAVLSLVFGIMANGTWTPEQTIYERTFNGDWGKQIIGRDDDKLLGYEFDSSDYIGGILLPAIEISERTANCAVVLHFELVRNESVPQPSSGVDASRLMAYIIRTETRPIITSDYGLARFYEPHPRIKARFDARLVHYDNGVATSSDVTGLVFNPDMEQDESDAANVIQLPSGTVSQGDKIFIPDSQVTSEVPASYFSPKYNLDVQMTYGDDDDNVIKSGVVDNRLMLPENVPPYVQVAGISDEEAVEQIVVFDDVYPHQVSSIGTIDASRTTTDKQENDDNTVTPTKYPDYWFKLNATNEETTTSGGTTTTETVADPLADFDPDWALEGGTLEITFQSGMLNGFTFEVVFNPANAPLHGDNESQWWRIVRNTELNIPNEILRPSVGDKFVLTGIDASKVGEIYVPNAEAALLTAANTYLAEISRDDSTYNCSLMSDSAKAWLDASMLYVGRRVQLYNPAYFGSAGRASRIIGYELKLDIPFDTPMLIVGDEAQYSRLGAIEDKINALAMNATKYRKGETYLGGSSSGGNGSSSGGTTVDLITTDSDAQESDDTAYSSLRTSQDFLSRRREESLTLPMTFLGGSRFGIFVEGESGTAIGSDGAISTNETLTAKDITADDITAQGDITAVDINASDIYASNIYASGNVEATDVTASGEVTANTATIDATLSAFEVEATDVRATDVYGSTLVQGGTVRGVTKVNTPLVEATTKVVTPRAEATEVITTSVKTADFNPDPLAGYGFGIYKDSTLNNDAKAVVDYLVVRKKMQVAVLEIAEYKSVNGGLVLSKANGVIESVEYTDDGTIYVIKLKERNQFVVGDLIRCQTWDMKIEPTSPLRYYWVEVQASSGLFIEV